MRALSPVPADLQRLSRRRWGIGVAGVFVLQLAVVGLLSPRLEIRKGVRSAQTQVFFLDVAQASVELARQFDVIDPTVFALPMSERAGPMRWGARQGAEPAGATLEPVRWLGADPVWFGGTGTVVSTSVPRVHRTTAEKPTPMVSPVAGPRVPVRERTQVDLDPGLKARGLEPFPEVPSLAHTNLLGASDVHVAVGADGAVFTAVLLQSCGWPTADARALALARALRFQPRAAGADRHWGTVRVRWHTVPPTQREGGGT